ncbi:MAG: type II secretion system minor pseudopilin GspI [Gammaproteobacteria bacterium]|jgi:general secretion pathway protein I
MVRANKGQCPRRQREYSRGFTLIEVIIALTIIAVGLAAVISAASSTVYNAAGLQERTFAHWVAMNEITRLQVMQEFPRPGTKHDSTLMAEHEWFWTREVIETQDENVRKVEVAVRANEDDENPLVHLTGFIGQPK